MKNRANVIGAKQESTVPCSFRLRAEEIRALTTFPGKDFTAKLRNVLNWARVAGYDGKEELTGGMYHSIAQRFEKLEDEVKNLNLQKSKSTF
jgi:hypothetical protein